MQIIKTYSGSSSRLLTPDKNDFAGVRGDDRATTLKILYPERYNDWEKRIIFNVEVKGIDGFYNPTYNIEDDVFKIPSVISNAVRSTVGYTIEFRKKDEEGDGYSVTEMSRMSYLVFSSTEEEMPRAMDSGVDNGLFVDYDTIGRSYIGSEYAFDSESDRGEISFAKVDGSTDTIRLEVPVLEDDKIPIRFIDETAFTKIVTSDTLPDIGINDQWHRIEW